MTKKFAIYTIKDIDVVTSVSLGGGADIATASVLEEWATEFETIEDAEHYVSTALEDINEVITILPVYR